MKKRGDIGYNVADIDIIVRLLDGRKKSIFEIVRELGKETQQSHFKKRLARLSQAKLVKFNKKLSLNYHNLSIFIFKRGFYKALIREELSKLAKFLKSNSFKNKIVKKIFKWHYKVHEGRAGILIPNIDMLQYIIVNKYMYRNENFRKVAKILNKAFERDIKTA